MQQLKPNHLNSASGNAIYSEALRNLLLDMKLTTLVARATLRQMLIIGE